MTTTVTATRLLPFDRFDGGRAGERGYGGTRSTGDCVPRAIAIATDQPYKQVHQELRDLQYAAGMRRSVSNGTIDSVWQPYLRELGWTEHRCDVPKGHRPWLLAEEEWLPMDENVIVSLPRHLTTVMRGVLTDTYDPSKRGTAIVAAFWTGPWVGRFGQQVIG